MGKANDAFEREILIFSSLLTRLTTPELFGLQLLVESYAQERRELFAQQLAQGIVPRDPIMRNEATLKARQHIEKAISILAEQKTLEAETFCSEARGFLESEYGAAGSIDLPPKEETDEGAGEVPASGGA